MRPHHRQFRWGASRSPSLNSKKPRKKAAELGVASVLYTFEPHPRRVPATRQSSTTHSRAPGNRCRSSKTLGIEHVVVESFNAVFAMQPADWFAREVIQKRLRSKAMVVGHDFRFGRGREGTAEGLRQRLPTLPIETLRLFWSNTIASSSRVRERVASGDVAGAASLLGRPYSIRGSVVPGSARGRELGFPTANIDSKNELMPQRGVYAVLVEVAGERVEGVANLGVRPTFGDHLFCVEVHLLDRQEDLHNQELAVQFIRNIREEKKFNSIDELKTQIQADISTARRMLQE